MFDFLEQVWKRRAPTNDEDPFNAILEILYMGQIFSRKHEISFCIFWNFKSCKFQNVDLFDKTFKILSFWNLAT